MHPEIKKYWENTGGHVWVQKEPNISLGTNVPAYWLDRADNDTRQLLAVPFEDKGLVYWINSKWKWVSEDRALKLIRLKAFF